jgi:hypothetical protein
MENVLTERCLTFKLNGEIETYNAVKITFQFIENDIDYVCYLSNGDYPPEFIVRRSNKKWDDILKMINSVKPCIYKYKKETFYITNEKRNGILGNMQMVCECN